MVLSWFGWASQSVKSQSAELRPCSGRVGQRLPYSLLLCNTSTPPSTIRAPSNNQPGTDYLSLATPALHDLLQTACLQTPVPRDCDLSVTAARIVKLSAVNSARSIGTPNRKYSGTAQRDDILGIRFSVDITLSDSSQ